VLLNIFVDAAIAFFRIQKIKVLFKSLHWVKQISSLRGL